MPGVLRKDRFANATAFSFIDVEQQATERLRAANAEAAGILRAARQSAEEEAARVRAEARAAGEAEGRKQGRERAYQEAQRAALVEARQQITKLSHALTVALTDYEQQRHERISAAEQELIRLAVKLAERICKVALKTQPQAALENIKAALALVQHEQDVELQLCADDMKLLEQIDPKLAGALGGKTHVKLTAREDLSPGACRLMTNAGTVDASIGEQLERAAEALLGANAV